MTVAAHLSSYEDGRLCGNAYHKILSGGTHRSMLKSDSDVILIPRRTLTSIPVRNLYFFSSPLLTAFFWKALIRLALFLKVIPVINHEWRLKLYCKL
jgi:hypothetical protein